MYRIAIIIFRRFWITPEFRTVTFTRTWIRRRERSTLRNSVREKFWF